MYDNQNINVEGCKRREDGRIGDPAPSRGLTQANGYANIIRERV
jgi:hypothetical protein